MTLKAAAVKAALCAKGMKPDENHHHMLRKKIDGVTHVVTRISHSAKDIDDGIAKLMAAQCVLNLNEFKKLVACPLTADAWIGLIRERCTDGRNPFLPHG